MSYKKLIKDFLNIKPTYLRFLLLLSQMVLFLSEEDYFNNLLFAFTATKTLRKKLITTKHLPVTHFLTVNVPSPTKTFRSIQLNARHSTDISVLNYICSHLKNVFSQKHQRKLNNELKLYKKLLQCKNYYHTRNIFLENFTITYNKPAKKYSLLPKLERHIQAATDENVQAKRQQTLTLICHKI